MKITKDKKNLIIEIPLWQQSFDALDEYVGDVPNVVGVITGNDEEQGFYQLNDLGYKGDIQLGGQIVHTFLSDEEFKKLCKELGIDIWYREP